MRLFDDGRKRQISRRGLCRCCLVTSDATAPGHWLHKNASKGAPDAPRCPLAYSPCRPCTLIPVSAAAGDRYGSLTELKVPGAPTGRWSVAKLTQADGTRRLVFVTPAVTPSGFVACMVSVPPARSSRSRAIRPAIPTTNGPSKKPEAAPRGSPTRSSASARGRSTLSANIRVATRAR
jgi:hypothetical protein